MPTRILLIDDNLPDRVRYRRMLQRGGDAFEITEAADGGKGLALLFDDSSAFDCVLLDVPADRVDRWWPAAAQAGTVLLGSTTVQRSVTAAYAALKMLAFEVGQQRYLWWMARASDAGAAEAAWRKIAQTARRFLQVQVDYAGAMPVDPMVARAERLRRPLVEAFPGSLGAAASAMLAERIDVPVPLPGAPEQAWHALLVGDPAQNARAAAGPAVERETPRSPSYDSTPSPSQKLSPFGAPGRTALVSR